MKHEIRTPGELKDAIRVAHGNVADGTLRDVTPHGLADVEITCLPEDGPWPDLVEHYFECNTCGWRFRLAVDTYNGSAGEWEPYRPVGFRA